jgi:hypothetical protein
MSKKKKRQIKTRKVQKKTVKVKNKAGRSHLLTLEKIDGLTGMSRDRKKSPAPETGRPAGPGSWPGRILKRLFGRWFSG